MRKAWLLITSLICLIHLPVSAAANPFLSSTARYTSDDEDERRELFAAADRIGIRATYAPSTQPELATASASERTRKRRRASASTSDEYADDVASPGHVALAPAPLPAFIQAIKQPRKKARPLTPAPVIDQAPSTQKSERCTLCPETFTDIQSLSEHIVTHAHSNPKKPINYRYTCPLCPCATKSRRILFLHVCAKHTNYKPEKCPHCDYATAQKTNLRCHIGVKHPNTEEAQEIITQRPSQRTGKQIRMLRAAARATTQNSKVHALAAPAPLYGPHPMPKKPIMFDGTEVPEDYEWSTNIDICPHCNIGFPDYDAVRNHLYTVHGISVPKY